VIDLAEALGVVAIVLEVLGQGDNVGQNPAEVGLEVVDAGGLGTQTGEQGGAGRAAHGLLAVGTGKPGALRSQAVDVGGLHLGATVAAQLGAHVVGGDEEHVAPFPRWRCLGQGAKACRCGQKARGAEEVAS